MVLLWNIARDERNLYLKDLTVYSFRNLQDSTIHFHPTLNLIEGDNGQGKSNLIEAIHVLSTTKTFRPVKNSSLAAWGKSEFSVFGQIQLEEGIQHSIGVSYQERQRRVYQNGDEVKSAALYLNIFPTVSFNPRDIDLVYGSPGTRRRYIDRYTSLLSPTAFSALVSYQKVLRSKNALLKEGVRDERQFEALNTLLAECSEIICRERRMFLTLLQPIFEEHYAQYANSDGTPSLTLRCSFSENGAKILSQADLLTVLNGSLKREFARYGSVVGPHLDEISFELNGRQAKSFASQGQARSLVLALLLSIVKVIESRTGVLPAVLLDDFSSELDKTRMTRFFEHLKSKKHQVFVTGTELITGDLRESDGNRYHVQDGRIIEKNR